MTTQARINSVEDRLESARQLEQGKPHAKERWATVAGKHLLREQRGSPSPGKKECYTCSEMPVPKGARLVGMMPCMAETA